MVLPLSALAVPLQNTGSYILGLIVLIHGGVKGKLVPLPRLRPQLLALSSLVVADHGVGRLQNMFGGAVVLLQADDPAALVLFFKGEDVLNGGSPEAVDGLVVVPHHAEVLIASGQGGGQQILQVVGVLVLVDEHIAELPLIELPHLVKLLEQTDGVENDVVKVQGACLPQPALVLCVYLGDLGQPEVPRPLALGQILVSQLHGILCPRDVAQHRPGRKLLIIDSQVLQNILHHPQGVVSVIDGKGGGEAQLLNIPAEDANTGGVKGAGPDIVGSRAQHSGQTVLQLARRLIGKGDGQNGPRGRRVQGTQPLLPGLVPRPGPDILLQEGQIILCHPLRHLCAVRAAAILHQVGDAVDEHGGLAAARSGQQQERTLRGQGGLLLLWVQR